MKASRLTLLGLALALPLTAVCAPAVALPSADAKKLADRYALTKTRIRELLGARLHPEPLPATPLPNPFYKSLGIVDPSQGVAPPNTGTELAPLPDAPDLSDADTLAQYATALKLTGYMILGGEPHLIINGDVCKVGDVVTVGTKERPVFLHILSLTPQEVVLRYNEATFTLPVRK